MKSKNPRFVVVAFLAVLAAFAMPQTVQAEQNWKATVGGQSKDLANQAIAFLPNEIWIHEFDSITWTFAADEIHTVTFLKASQVVPPFAVGCPGFSSTGATFDGSTCLTTPPLVTGASFKVNFPKAGNYKLVCLVHNQMTGLIHVLPASVTLPHDQAFYEEQGEKELHNLLTDTDKAARHHGHEDWNDMLSVGVLSGKNGVVAGIGEMAATPGGFQALSVLRFLNGTIEVHAGDTVEWGNLDPALPHTITFGVEPANPIPPSPNVFKDPDGVLHATVSSSSDSVHSGFLVGAPQDRIGSPQVPAGTMRFRITFAHAGTYKYICALHDTLGMVGKVIVLP
ncbi:MAG: hypothetical protein JWQ49_5902 [Edaphobacter sp.]|nr:hypothetical protein [Edaphobacter sp.]